MKRIVPIQKCVSSTLQTYVHDTEKMVERSVDLFEQVTRAKTS